jgi:hypothetical protein
MKKVLIICAVTLLFGCSNSIKSVDVMGKEKSCVKECADSHSLCISQDNQIGSKTEMSRACKESYSICTNTCPI